MKRKHRKGQLLENCIHCGEPLNIDEKFVDVDYLERTIEIQMSWQCISCDEFTTQTHVFKLGDCIRDDIE